MKIYIAASLMVVCLCAPRASAQGCVPGGHGDIYTDHFVFAASSDQGARGDIVGLDFTLTLLDPQLQLEGFEGASPEPFIFGLVGCYDSRRLEFVAEAPSEWYEQLAFLPYFFVFPGVDEGEEGRFLISSGFYRGAVSAFLASGTPFPLMTLYFRVLGEPDRSTEIRFSDDALLGRSCVSNHLDYNNAPGVRPLTFRTRSTLHVPGTVCILPGEATRTELPDLPPLARVYDEAPTAESAQIRFELSGPPTALPGQEDVRFELWVTSAQEWSGFMASVLFPPESLELDRVEEHTRPGLVTIDKAAGGVGLLMANSRRRVGGEEERVRVATLVFRVRQTAQLGETVDLRLERWGNFFHWLAIQHREGTGADTLPVQAEVSPLVLTDGLLRLAAPEAALGDVNLDGGVNISDAVSLLNHLFLGGSVRCRAAGDFRPDGEADLSDAVAILNALFLASPWPSGGPVSCQES
jgi:hypothetical protein